MNDRATVPRGRHAPPLEERLSVQRRRLFQAAASVFASVGYAAASAEGIARAAGMSKATFYEHFANKEECVLALFDQAVADLMLELGGGAPGARFASYEDHVRESVGAFLQTLGAHPDAARTLLVEVAGA